MRLSSSHPVVALLLLVLMSGAGGASHANERFITLASTTSTDNSGLYGALLPAFEAQTGIAVRVVAVGTGQALRLARAGDADVLIVHDRVSEEAFVAAGYGVARHDFMYNDFVLVGPEADPAGVRGGGDVLVALRAIARKKAPFVSRADDSGTHKAELRLWSAAGVDPRESSGTWYREAGSGMGATLNTSSAMGAYTLADRGTWLAFRNRGELVIVVEGDPPLFNPYGVILVDPRRHPHVKADDAAKFVDWLLSEKGQQAIGAFEVEGERLFTPNAKPAPQASDRPAASP